MAKELVLVSHGRFCEELKASTEMIIGPQESIHTVALLPEEGPEDVYKRQDTTILIDYMLNRFGNIVKNLTVFPENMIRNMNSTFGLIFSQRAMLTLIEKGMTREQAYDLVQPKTAQSWDNQVDFKPLLEACLLYTSRCV